MFIDIGFLLDLVYVIFLLVGVTILYILIHRYVIGVLRRRVRRAIMFIFDFILILFIVSIVIGGVASLYGFREVFAIVFGLFIIGILIVLIGSRHVLEEYMSGVFATEIHDLRIGDYIEIDHFRGHIVALNETSIVIRDSHRDLVYIPYTKILHTPFKRFRVEEGHEIIIPVIIPYTTDLKDLREEIKKRSQELGVENVRVSIESFGERNIRMIIRGIIRDLRREEDIRYALLDEIYSMAFRREK